MGSEEHPELNADGSPKEQAPRDIVDTFWDIPPISFADGLNAGTVSSSSGSAPKLNQTPTPPVVPSFEEILHWPSTGTSTSAPADEPHHVGGATFSADAPNMAGSKADGNRPIPPLFVPPTRSATASTPAVDHGTDDLAIDFSAIEHNAAPVEEPQEPEAPGGSGSRANARTAAQATPRKSGKVIAIAATVAVAVAASAVAGGLWWRGKQQTQEELQLHRTALAACTDAASQYSTAKAALDKAMSDAKSAQSITADQVADASTVDALNKAVGSVKTVDAVACKSSDSTTALKQLIKTAQNQTKTATSSTKTITDAVQAVNASKSAKDTANVQQTLQAKIEEAQTLLYNSGGAVDDNQTRVTLETDIANANTVLAQQGNDTQAMQDALNALDVSMQSVNTSMANYAAILAAQQQAYVPTAGTTTDTTAPTTPARPEDKSPTDESKDKDSTDQTSKDQPTEPQP